MDKQQIKDLVDSLSLEDLIGQVLSIVIPGNLTDEALEKLEADLAYMKPGAVFVNSLSAEDIKKVIDLTNKYTKVPVIVQADTEIGPFPCVKDCSHRLPRAMAWGACDDATLIEKGGEATAQLCRKNGIHWAMAPVVDINLLKDDPVTCTRATSDSPKQVVKIAGAYLRGLQKNGLMATAAKHFPGGGCSDINGHFGTGVILQSREQWFDTYGYVYKEIIKTIPYPS